MNEPSWDDGPVVCMTHRRFIPCRSDDPHMYSSAEDDVRRVYEWQNGHAWKGTTIHAPFTNAQVESIQSYQDSGRAHPFTRHLICGTEGCSGVLRAAPEGMICHDCGQWLQLWVHDYMADWSWTQWT